MKNRKKRKAVFALIAVLLYILILASGIAAVNVYPVYYNQRPRLIRQARIIAQEHLEDVDEALNYMTSSTTRILVYDKDGNYQRYISMKDFGETIVNAEWLDKYLVKTLKGEEVFAMIPAHEDVYNPMHIWLVIGVPIIEDNAVAGSVYLIKNLENLQEATIAFFIYFTIFYWLGVYLFASRLLEKRKHDDMKHVLLINTTHALKTPLVSMRALAETLCDEMETDPEKQKQYCGLILQEVSRQENMVQDALQLSKMQSGAMDYSKTTVALDEIVGQIREKYMTLCEYLDISLYISKDISTCPPLHTNADCIKQLLSILLDNSMKFVDKDGNIWLDVSVHEKKATVYVIDDGTGIDEKTLPHVFERFFKGVYGNNEFGNGLGLAIAGEIVHGLKEKIWVESKWGTGTTFFFTVHVA